MGRGVLELPPIGGVTHRRDPGARAVDREMLAAAQFLDLGDQVVVGLVGQPDGASGDSAEPFVADAGPEGRSLSSFSKYSSSVKYAADPEKYANAAMVAADGRCDYRTATETDTARTS